MIKIAAKTTNGTKVCLTITPKPKNRPDQNHFFFSKRINAGKMNKGKKRSIHNCDPSKNGCHIEYRATAIQDLEILKISAD